MRKKAQDRMHTEKIIISSIKTLIENPATFRQPFIDQKNLNNDDPTVDEATELVLMSDTLIGRQFIWIWNADT